jgi:hypothetical protein
MKRGSSLINTAWDGVAGTEALHHILETMVANVCAILAG